MQIGSYDFRPPLGYGALTVILFPIFITLGLWQVDRGEQRREQQASTEQRIKDTPIILKDLITNPEEIRFRRVKARGFFEKQYAFLLDNAVNSGHAGYHVITPFRMEGTEIRVLVNRGWVPVGNDRRILPQIETPKEIIELQGFVDIFKELNFTLGGLKPITDKWPKRWPYLDISLFTNAVKYQVQPILILQDKNSPNGYVRDWDYKFFQLTSNINAGYALQWFSFAVIILITFLMMSTRKRKSQTQG